ncbi:MAG: tetratricopeptide repeat protein [Flavobacteriales bacterium]
MKLKPSYRAFFLAFFFVVLAGCSTNKDTFIHRGYHNTTARYNGYYYAELSIDKGLKKIRKDYQEDYTNIIPVFDDGDESSASVAYPEMDRAIKKLSKVIDRHSMEINGKQKCKWIDDSYLLLGRSYYYKRNYTKATKMFTYVSKKFRRKPIRPLALIWLARTHIEAGKLDKARNILELMEEERILQKRERKDLQDFYDEVYAQFHIERENYKKAAKKLERAVDKKRWLLDRDRKERLLFILGQLYQKMEKIDKGNRHFSKVVNLSPPYEMAFQAKIKQALSYRQGVRNSRQIKAQLLEMLKDDKNIDYYDQIYFALAEIELAQGDKEEGVRYLEKSVEAENISKPQQRTEAYLKLADIHFKKEAYEKAQNYYQQAFGRMERSHTRYLEVERRANSLKELVDNLRTIEEQDSLLSLAKMDKKERRDKIRATIEKRVEKAREQQRKKRASKRELKKKNSFNSGSKNSGSSFYFYNQKAKSQGYNRFKRIWGDRKLQDDWRRSSTGGGSVQKFKDPAADSLESEAGVVTDPSYYEKKLPMSQKAQKAFKEKIAQALYDAGQIYREDLEDPNEATKMFQELVDRFDMKAYTPPALYQLYRIQHRKEEKGADRSAKDQKGSEHYKRTLLKEYPNSPHAKLIRNPDGLKEEQEARKKALAHYKKTLKSYRKGKFSMVIERTNKALSNGTGEKLRAKHLLLKGLSLGRKDSLEGAKKVFRKVVKDHKEKPEASRAQKLLERMKGRASSAGAPEANLKESPFKKAPKAKHYFCIVLPKGTKDVKKIKKGLSDFDQKYFGKKDLKVSSTVLRNKDPLVMVKKFGNKKAGMDYYRSFLQRSSVIEGLNLKKTMIFIISQENFGLMFRKQKSDRYMAYFRKVYLEE